MSDRATDDAADAEVARALATHEASRERTYYDAEGDASVRAGYYAAIEADAPPQGCSARSAPCSRTRRRRAAPTSRPSASIRGWTCIATGGCAASTPASPSTPRIHPR